MSRSFLAKGLLTACAVLLAPLATLSSVAPRDTCDVLTAVPRLAARPLGVAGFEDARLSERMRTASAHPAPGTADAGYQSPPAGAARVPAPRVRVRQATVPSAPRRHQVAHCDGEPSSTPA